MPWQPLALCFGGGGLQRAMRGYGWATGQPAERFEKKGNVGPIPGVDLDRPEHRKDIIFEGLQNCETLSFGALSRA